MHKPTANPNRTRRTVQPSTLVEGERVRLTDLPLVAFRLACGHVGREYAVLKGDQVFCTSCSVTKRVTRILAE